MDEKSLKKEPKIKIYVSYHKEAEKIENKYIFPIHVGAKNSKVKMDMLRDDSGDNISEKNEMYCELTAQYWAWKNEEADYYGFMHYRRHFIFTQESALKNKEEIIKCDYINSDYINNFGLLPEQIKAMVTHNDIILPQIESVTPYENVFEHYNAYVEQHKEDYELMLTVIQDIYPEYYRSAIEYSNCKYGYFCNMFIMKKEYFEKYSTWLFGILFEMQERKDYSDYSIKEYRVLAYLAERLLGIYVTYIKKNTNANVLELQHTFVENIELQEKLKPAYNENNILIFMSSDDYYVPYLGTLLYSIIKNSSKEFNYDLVVLTQNIKEKNKNRLKALAIDKNNVSIRFFNVAQFVKNKNFNTENYALETYYRLFASEIFIHYEKGLYLDSDMVVNTDIAQLFQENIDEYFLAAIRDYDEMGHVRRKDDDWDEYLKNYVGIKDLYSPFQGGVLLINLYKFRQENISDILIKKATSKSYRIADQDVLNLCCENKVHYVDPAWDIMVDNNNKKEEIFSYSPIRFYKEYLEAVKNPKIVHFCGWPKPWFEPESDMAEYFWKYARETPFYENILERMMKTYLIGKTAKTTQSDSLVEKVDNHGVKVNGVETPIYLDGIMIKVINKFNSKYPIGSKRRERLRRLINVFVRG